MSSDNAPEKRMSTVWHNSTCEVVVLYIEKESAVQVVPRVCTPFLTLVMCRSIH